MIILGISALYHDSAAAIIKDGEILAAAQEERFTRVKHDRSIPFHAINYCLKAAALFGMEEVDKVVYYDNPLLTLDRFVHNAAALRDNDYLIETALPHLFEERLRISETLRKRYGFLGAEDKLYVTEHHISHAASAFYPSPFEDAAVLTIDGVGEWETTIIGIGEGNGLRIIEEIEYPHSLGLFYSTFTAFCGFKVNSGDYKFMGLAPYGEPVYYDLLKEKIIRVKGDGSYKLNLDYFDFYRGKFMYNDALTALFGGSARTPESRITRREMDIAASVQKLTEEIVIALGRHAREISGKSNLVMAGGVALNCVANGKLLKEKVFDKIWIQPAAGDAGGALGCALYAYYQTGAARDVSSLDSQKGSYLGPEFTSEEIGEYLAEKGYAAHRCDSKKELYERAANHFADEKVVGWFQGRMEFGPRALGNRSILGDARSSTMQSRLNLKIKYRESFRPFAPSVLAEDMNQYFDLTQESPYMLLVGLVNEERRLPFDKETMLRSNADDMIPIVNKPRSDVPAITHLDYSARVQTVDKERNPDYYGLISAFKEQTGCSVIVNTSFNVRGEPIVCTPEDAYTCFMRTEMDVLVLGDYILLKEEQPAWTEEKDWRNAYGLD